jgi:Family of unknown function (DUF5685)
MFGFLPGPCGCAGEESRGAWQSHFCGLCNTLRQRYGLWSRWLINRDSTFLALAGSALAPAEPAATRTTCCNPLGRKRLLIQNEPQMRYAAAVTVCALSVKLRDDADDERGLRRLGARAGSRLLGRARDRALADLSAAGFPADRVAHIIGGQSAVEGTGVSLAAASAPTAAAYGAIFGHLPAVTGAAPAASEPLTAAGAALGRLIYTVDAWEDYEADRRRNRFNPLPPDETERRSVAADAVRGDLGVLARALDALPFLRFSPLLTALAGPRLQHRTLTRLGMSGPPPLPPDPAGGPQPPEWRDETRKKYRGRTGCGCGEWCAGCSGRCCGCGRTRARQTRRSCCDHCNWLPDCCDCPGDGCCDCDCSCG